MKTWSLKKENLRRFGEDFSRNDFSKILDMKDDASGAFDRITGIIQPIYGKTCQGKFLNTHKDELRKPWITKKILEASDLRN